MENKKKEIGIGILIAVFATIAGMFLYIELFSKYDFEMSLEMIRKGNLVSQMITLGAVANLFVFFVFLKKKQDLRARGVLIATIITAFITLIMKIV